MQVCPGQEYQRKLHPDDIPLRAQAERMKRGESCHFLVRRNPNYARRRQLLAALNDVSSNVGIYPSPTVSNKSFDANSTISSLNDSVSLLDMSIESLPDDINSLLTSDEDEDCNSNSSSGSSDTSTEGGTRTTIVRRTPTTLQKQIASVVKIANDGNAICSKCRNSFKSCEFCHKNSALMQLQRRAAATSAAAAITTPVVATYNPVYNIREIRTATHSFSSLGNDKKLLDIHLNGRFDASTCRMRPQSVYVGRDAALSLQQHSPIVCVATTPRATSKLLNSDVNGNSAAAGSTNASSMLTTSTSVSGEVVNNNPSKGLGHFVYI